MKRPSDKALARHKKVLRLRLQVVRLQQRVRQLEEGCMQTIADIGAEQLTVEQSARVTPDESTDADSYTFLLNFPDNGVVPAIQRILLKDEEIATQVRPYPDADPPPTHTLQLWANTADLRQSGYSQYAMQQYVRGVLHGWQAPVIRHIPLVDTKK